MNETDAEQYVDAAAARLGLAIAPEWKKGVLTFFEIADGMARLVAADGAVSEHENAPIFTPADAE